MNKEIHKVLILPARFIEVVNEEKIRVKMMLDDGIIQDRTMSKTLIDDIINPDLLLVGIITGAAYMQLDVCDGNEFNEIFEEKWDSI